MRWRHNLNCLYNLINNYLNRYFYTKTKFYTHFRDGFNNVIRSQRYYWMIIRFKFFISSILLIEIDDFFFFF